MTCKQHGEYRESEGDARRDVWTDFIFLFLYSSCSMREGVFWQALCLRCAGR